MNLANTFIGKIFKRSDLPQTGIYHYRLEEEDSKARLHLRIDPDRRGILMINANRVIHLNPSAATVSYTHLTLPTN